MMDDHRLLRHKLTAYPTMITAVTTYAAIM